MEYRQGEIISKKVLNELDKFVIRFLNELEEFTSYVIVSGYVSILLGRSRASEDVDLLVPKMKQEKFSDLFSHLLNNGYECANTSNPEEAYEMLSEHAIRFYEKGLPIPNIEFKQISNDIHKFAFENKIKLTLKEKQLFISPLELQIAYKLSLLANGSQKEISSDKDFEDAKHIYSLFKEKLNKEELFYFVKLFKVQEKMEMLENE